MALPPRWRLALIVLAALVAIALVWLALAQPPPATTHVGGMTPEEMCAHMPEHCSNG